MTFTWLCQICVAFRWWNSKFDFNQSPARQIFYLVFGTKYCNSWNTISKCRPIVESIPDRSPSDSSDSPIPALSPTTRLHPRTCMKLFPPPTIMLLHSTNDLKIDYYPVIMTLHFERTKVDYKPILILKLNTFLTIFFELFSLYLFYLI